MSESIATLLRDLWNLRIVTPWAKVTKVYEGPDDKILFPGQIQVNVGGDESMGGENSYLANAWMVIPYGLRPDTEGDSKSQNREERPLNQHFGFYGMPRVGDTVFLIGVSIGDSEIPTDYFALGTIFGSLMNVPPPVDAEDLQIIHRSGASIRLNDTFAGGGSISSTGTVSESPMSGLTGNLSMTGNRVMILAGEKYLPQGLMAKYGDPRTPFKDAGIETFEGVEGGKKYSAAFSNDEENDTYFKPFTDTSMTEKKFLSPPSTTDALIPLTDNTLLLSQHGGGAIRIDDHNADEGLSRLTMTATSMSVMVGEEYQALGRAGKSTGLDNDAPGIGEGAANYGGVGTGKDTFEIQHKTGTRITIDEDGAIYITTQDPSAKIMIDTKDSGATIDIGMANKPAVKEGDESYVGIEKSANVNAGVNATFGNLGLPVVHAHDGHTHTAKATQQKVFI